MPVKKTAQPRELPPLEPKDLRLGALLAAWMDPPPPSLDLGSFHAALAHRQDDAPGAPREQLLLALLAEMSQVLNDSQILAARLACCLRRRQRHDGQHPAYSLIALRRAEAAPLRDAGQHRDRLALWLADASHWLATPPRATRATTDRSAP